MVRLFVVSERLAPVRANQHPQSCPYSKSPSTPSPRQRAWEGTRRAGPKGSTWLGRAGKRRVGSMQLSGSEPRGQAQPPRLLHSRPKPLLGSREAVTTAWKANRGSRCASYGQLQPAAASCDPGSPPLPMSRSAPAAGPPF